MHSKQIGLTLSTIAILSIGLAGCGNSSTNHRNHPATSTSQTSSTNHEASAYGTILKIKSFLIL